VKIFFTGEAFFVLLPRNGLPRSSNRFFWIILPKRKTLYS